MKVNTLQLMMSVADLPASNFFEQMMAGKLHLNGNDIATQINLLQDALQKKKNWMCFADPWIGPRS